MQLTLMMDAARYDTQALSAHWNWLIPAADSPLFISAMGDWVFGKPNGSLWALSLLEGDYRQIAQHAAEYNQLNKSPEWLNDEFCAEWLLIASHHGLSPAPHQCLGWQLHPLLGGAFEVANLTLFDMHEHQANMARMHRRLQQI